MKINTRLSNIELTKTKYMVDKFNKKLHGNKKPMDMASQDKFLKLLVTELKYQDPLEPLKNRDFIAQMAQFSSLEQMTRINKRLDKIEDMFKISGAYGLIGRSVSYTTSDGNIHDGIVNNVSIMDGKPVLTIGNNKVNLKDIVRINMGGGAQKINQRSN